ncbi:tRNA pseudouridine(38/39) synthase isoform X2 [Leptidea sinapis]|uniref:tRNA pseudouridine(38/39) synthase isoform X2 n=1 Tax=Leptidea sinapis TaxID=189913 RepID=UPI0021C30B9F|nr:tRNA pseudouridine(38/39) synthase isoform X2 [Leptidea sinapis]
MEKVPPKRKIKNSTKEELISLEKEELIDRILQLEAHNVQLKNIISKNLSEAGDNQKNDGHKKFDFSKCHYRKVLLRFLYFGWDYQGLAVQEDSIQTIEHHLFNALIKSCLIEDRPSSDYHRCGRTDKGVSAFGQVISIKVRSKHPPPQQNEPNSLATEMPYCKILNRLLPKDIRAVSWMPIPDDKQDFSARFDCKKRQYKYYFPKSSLNIAAMREACSLLIGSHDFRHLCKMDVGNGVTEFRRKIISADIIPIDDSAEVRSMHALVIEGNAFLWHQIRCIMGVLLLIGEGKEHPRVISELLDVETHTSKPQYNMALHIPLNLFKCTYNVDDSCWVYDNNELRSTMIKDCIKELEDIYTKQIEKIENSASDMKESDRCIGVGEREDMNCDVEERDGSTVQAYTDCLLQGVKPRVYTPLLKREKCSSLEEKIEYYKKKRKIVDAKNKL